MTANRSLTPYTLEFTIAGLPKMSNQLLRGHWRAKLGHTKEWKRRVATAVALAVKPRESLTTASITLTRCSATEPDFDGLVSGFKPVIDGLVECGVLAGDKQSNIGQPTYRWERAKARQGMIKVEVVEV